MTTWDSRSQKMSLLSATNLQLIQSNINKLGARDRYLCWVVTHCLSDLIFYKQLLHKKYKLFPSGEEHTLDLNIIMNCQ